MQNLISHNLDPVQNDFNSDERFRSVAYLERAHYKYNLNYNNPSFVPVSLHNLPGCETDFFIKKCGYLIWLTANLSVIYYCKKTFLTKKIHVVRKAV